MTYAALSETAKDVGFTAWANLDVSTISLRQEVRDMCAANVCGMYAKSWSCPPGCGTLELCQEQIWGKTQGILVQTCGNVENSFDYEAMMEIEAIHKASFLKMHRILREKTEAVLAIGAGCCSVCDCCSYPTAPCRFQKDRVQSMEAYGMLVFDLCKKNGLQYYYGQNKIAFVSCFLL